MNSTIALKISIGGFLAAAAFSMVLACCCIVLCMRVIANTRVITPRTLMPLCHVGVSPKTLTLLPMFVYRSSVEENLECVICLSELLDGENGRWIPQCGHHFHADCVDVWFQSHSTCPICRTMIDTGYSDIADV
ncbi:RING-H2 finger protein ATL3 [Rhynchospora pubera]|uniref:RING-type E3 ubiquitin transferase n=1 Tax=Rhynchospora pubera TaxID=906938 RepID=A0AAV8HT18_9POAL|nr:RING-H2 finger protein ATL3 [Rhynchospora pubera]